MAAALVDVVTTHDHADVPLQGEVPRLDAVVLLRGPLPEGIEQVYRSASTDPPLLTLARALTASRGWASERATLIVARPEPTPALVAIGRFDAADRERLEALRNQLREVLPRTRYLEYDAAEAACVRLAERLLERFGADAIGTMRFVGLPRGGVIVLGMLAYALGLAHAQLDADARHSGLAGPLVVVDDSVISGARVRQFLARRSEGQLIVACLHSHPEARAALCEGDDRILDVVSAHDFHDHAPRALGDGYDAWRDRWRQRSDPDCVWVGQPEHLCYPWSEPDLGVWNAASEREEPGWSVMPRELCLARRLTPGREALRAQLQPPPSGLVRTAEHVVYGFLGDDVVIADLAASTCYGLEGGAAVAWRAVLACGEEQAAADAIAVDYDVDPDTVIADVRSLVAELRAAGLLEGRDA